MIKFNSGTTRTGNTWKISKLLLKATFMYWEERGKNLEICRRYVWVPLTRRLNVYLVLFFLFYYIVIISVEYRPRCIKVFYTLFIQYTSIFNKLYQVRKIYPQKKGGKSLINSRVTKLRQWPFHYKKGVSLKHIWRLNIFNAIFVEPGLLGIVVVLIRFTYTWQLVRNECIRSLS